MHRVGYDETTDVLIIVGEGVYPAGSLSVTMDGDGMVRIVSLAHRTEAYAHWSDIGTLEGEAFSDGSAALAYLTTELAKRRGAPVALAPTYTAASVIGGHRVVRLLPDGSVDLASCADPDCLGSVIGITTQAADVGAQVAVAVGGEVDEPSWSWQPGPIYLGEEGALTQVAPASGFVVRVALALGASRILVAIDDPYQLAA